MAAALAAGALLCGWAQSADASVTLAVLPQGATVGDLARAGLSPGLLSAGIGDVPAEQTFLDISQGNRVNEALYDRDLPPLAPFRRQVPGWREIVQRADDVPAEIEPGLLASELRSAGVPISAQRQLVAPALAAATRSGLVSRTAPGECVRSTCSGVWITSATIGDLSRFTARLHGDDLLIALTSPPPARDEALPIGIAGRGFDGDLTSDSTRTRGYVLSTDIAPTILRRLGMAIPDEMNGEPIRAEGSVEPGAIVDRADRMKTIPERRIPVVAGCLAAWILVALAVALLAPPLRRRAAAWLALAIAYMPLMLLAGAALEPDALVEALVVGVGAGVLAVATLRLAPGWAGLAIACAASTVGYAIDVVAGSRLTALSLLGPDPIFGARFFGIGNELEALIAVMVPVGVGAGLTAAGEGRLVRPSAGVAGFLLAGFAAAFVFGAGRFGADVGAAIVLPLGAVVAVGSLSTSGRIATTSRQGLVIAVIAAPIAALLFLALVDLVSGGNAHLTRSVLDAGGPGDLADAAERRLRLSAHGFSQAAMDPLFWIVIAGVAGAITRWRRIDAWLQPAPLARAGVIGACAAVAAGTLVNDSGATFLVLGWVAVAAALTFSWSQMPRNTAGRSGK